MAERFGRPVLTFLDTPGASPTLDDEKRGQSWAIAENMARLARLRVPVIVTVIGEGGSGGALALGVGDRVLMLEHAIYSVASPEAAAAIIWRDSDHAEEAAAALRLTAPDLLRAGLIDRVVPEPDGGAHRDFDAAAAKPPRPAGADAAGTLRPQHRRSRQRPLRQVPRHGRTPERPSCLAAVDGTRDGWAEVWLTRRACPGCFCRPKNEMLRRHALRSPGAA